jgi:hypothetical protein
MKKIVLGLIGLSFSLSLCMANAAVHAPPKAGRFGLGGMVGSPTAVTGKYWLSDVAALDFGVGFYSGSWTILYGDFLWHVTGLFGTSTKFGQQTKAYFGGGAGVGFWNRSESCNRWRCSSRTSTNQLFIRGLFGGEWYPPPVQLGVFVEVGPSIGVTPEGGGSIDVSTGARYYF